MSEKMNVDAAPKIVSSLVKALQVVCHGYVEFDTNIEIVGHIHINVDRQQKYNYVLNECVNRSDGRSSTFISNSFYAKPPKDGVTERDRPPEPLMESDIMVFAASPYNDPETSSRNVVFNSTTPVSHAPTTNRQNKRDAQGNSIRQKTGATASSTVLTSAPRVPPLHPSPRDSSYDSMSSDPAKRLRKSSSADRLDETRRPVQSHQRAGSEERSNSDLVSEATASATSASVSSQQPSHTATSASLSAAQADSDANRSRAQDLKEEEEVVLIKEEICEEELLRVCGGPVFPGDNFSQSHPPTTTSSRVETSATETSSRGQAHHSSDLSGSNYLGSGADYAGPSTSYGDPHDTSQSHLYPVSLHPNVMNTMPGSGGVSMMSPELTTAASTSTSTHPAFRTTDSLPGRPGNSSSGTGDMDDMNAEGEDLPVFFPTSSAVVPLTMSLPKGLPPLLSRGADHRKARLSPMDLALLRPDASLFQRSLPLPLLGIKPNLQGLLPKDREPPALISAVLPSSVNTVDSVISTCHICDRMFYSRKQLYNHQTLDHNLPLACSICGKEYKTATGLEEHEVTHKGPRKFLCEFPGCSKSFSRQQHLQGHINHVHLALQPFKCDMCGASYASRNTCLNHMRTCKANPARELDGPVDQLPLQAVHSGDAALLPNVELGSFQNNPASSWTPVSTSSSTSGGCDPNSPENVD